MAALNYGPALARLLKHEGGYTNHPSDPGGPTNYGITIGDYRRYIKSDATAQDVRDMPLRDAKIIYRQKYWNAMCCDDLPAGVDDTIFDYGVNSGIGRAGKVLRRVLDLPDNTSVVTPQVIAAARDTNPKQLVSDICAERLRFLQQLKTWPVFGRGWGRRVKEVREFDLALVDGVAAPSKPQPSAPGPGKGTVAIPPGAQPATASGLGTVGAMISQWLYQAGEHPWVVVAAIVGTVLAIAIGYVAWNRWQKAKQEAPA